MSSAVPAAGSAGEAPELWICDTATVQDPETLSRYRRLLDPEECARLDRFHFARDRHVFLVSHALLRTVLAHETGISPADLRFVRGEQGRPYLSPLHAVSVPAFSFNLSHSGTHAVVGVSKGGGEIGADIEAHRLDRRFDELAQRYFARAEVEHLRCLAATVRSDRFYDIWTLKEAYLKARGTGLQLPLADFAFSFEGETICFEATAGLDDRPERWGFWCGRIAGGFSVSLAVDAGSAAARVAEPVLNLLNPLGAATPLGASKVVARSQQFPRIPTM